jgi:predicted NBD/HSP70 family sugar kinase
MAADGMKKNSIAPDILQHIYTEGPINRTSLAAELNLSKSAVTQHVTNFLNLGLCYEMDDLSNERLGRTPKLIQISPDYTYALNLIFEEERSYLAISNLANEIIWQTSFRMNMEEAYEDRLENVQNSIETYLKLAGLEASQIGLLAIAAPGYYNTREKHFYADGIFGTWRISDIAEEVSATYGWQVYFENDMNAACWGEYVARSKQVENILYIGIGLGLGASMIVDGKLYYGHTGEAGEISFIEVWDKRTKSMQPLSHVVSLRALMAIMADQGYDVKVEDIRNLIKIGDPVVSAILMDMVETAAQVIKSCVLLLNPELIILGGRLPELSNIFYEGIRRALGTCDSCPTITTPLIDKEPNLNGLVQIAGEQLIKRIQEEL